MLRTLDRYVIRETIPPFLLSLLVFTFILEIPPIMRDLEQLVAKGVSWSAAGRILLTLIPQALGLTIPMALLTGLLIGLGRLSADREAVALLACGVSPYRLLRPVLLMAVLAGGATLYVMIEAIPNANQTFREITWELVSKKVENDIRPRVFFEDFPGWVLYARDDPDEGGGWKDVLVADTRKPNQTTLFFASQGRVVLDRAQRRVDLVLTDGVQYSTVQRGAFDTSEFQKDLLLPLDPNTVFSRAELPRGITEKTIDELKLTIAQKLTAQYPLSPHPEIMAWHLKFSVPVACFVFAVIGLALGLTVAREGKLAGFVVAIAVIFAYYTVMQGFESQTKGYYRAIEAARGLGTASFFNAHMARWWPNIILGVFGIAALVWRARYSQSKLPVRLPSALPHLPSSWHRQSAPAPQAAAARTARGGRRVVLVVRVPHFRLPGPGILDRYVGRLYLRIAGLSFVALIGLFYIATFLDKTDKMFKGEASSGLVLQLLAYMTPQFVYFVIPIATLLAVLVTFGMLSRTSELTVMKACGISLYRVTLPLIALSLVGTLALFALEQEVLARANRQADILDSRIKNPNAPAKTFDPLHRRWIVGRSGIYHYAYFDSRAKALNGLWIYTPAASNWRLEELTYVARAEFTDGAWRGLNGWSQRFAGGTTGKWQPFAERKLEQLEPPDYFETEQPQADMMTVAELRDHIEELRGSGFNVVPQMVDLQKKLAFPFVTLVMTLLAVPFGVTMGKRGTLYGIGLAIALALSYWVLFHVFLAIGRAGLLSPFLAAWTPNIIVIACAAYLLLTAKT